MKRIVLLATGLAYGGAETQLMCLAARLKARGWEVQVVSLLAPRAYAEELKAAGIPVASLSIHNKLPNPCPLFRLAQLIRAWRPQILHSHMVHANLLARLVRPLTPTPVLICTAHSIDEGGRFRELLYRLTDPLCDITTQISRVGLERYVRVGAVPRHKIRYIPNGVDTERFCPDSEARIRLRRELRLETAFVWLAVGRFDPPKDYPSMLEAFRQVVRERPDTVLLIVGDGPLRTMMEGISRNLGLESQVRFLGIRQDVHHLMNAADAYVMSSAWEGMPMVLLEAHATGLPIVTTDVGGNREVVQDLVTGFLVPPKDPKVLAQAMLRLMNLPEEERHRMGQAGREHIEINFSLDRVVDQWETLYKELLARKGIHIE